jgi:glycerol-3-phosphate acyltransferase PlsY
MYHWGPLSRNGLWSIHLLDGAFQTNADVALMILVGFIVTMIILKHKSNIQRLLRGEENKISFSKKGKS